MTSGPVDFARQVQYGFNRVVQFNDHDDTSHADVMALFDRAIKRAARATESRG